MMAARRPHGCAKDPAEFLSGLKAAGERWSPMQAARLVIGEAADTIRKDMGDEWLLVVMAAHLADARDQGEWSFAHTTMQAWLDYQQDLVDEEEYRRKIAEAAQDGLAEYCRVI